MPSFARTEKRPNVGQSFKEDKPFDFSWQVETFKCMDDAWARGPRVDWSGLFFRPRSAPKEMAKDEDCIVVGWLMDALVLRCFDVLEKEAAGSSEWRF